jgi:hypothetical protein
MSEELKRDAVLPPPRLTEAEKQALLEPWLERRRAQFTAEVEAAAKARVETQSAEDTEFLGWSRSKMAHN